MHGIDCTLWCRRPSLPHCQQLRRVGLVGRWVGLQAEEIVGVWLMSKRCKGASAPHEEKPVELVSQGAQTRGWGHP